MIILTHPIIFDTPSHIDTSNILGKHQTTSVLIAQHVVQTTVFFNMQNLWPFEVMGNRNTGMLRQFEEMLTQVACRHQPARVHMQSLSLIPARSRLKIESI